MLERKNVNLRVVEKEDLPFLREWRNSPEFIGQYQSMSQTTMKDLEKQYDNLVDEKWFFIERKDGTKIGTMNHRPLFGIQEIGSSLLPSERGKGYCSEAVMIMVDYLFLSKDIVRIQAHTEARNTVAHRVLQKAGLKKEGTFRKEYFVNGEWRDSCIFAILREEWKEPKILTRTT